MPLSGGDPEVIGGYELLDRLGSGGMGVVYLARSASGRRVAVKLVHAQFAEDNEFRVRFRQEIAAARRVSGAFTAPVVDADPEAERPWMATLYVPGPTLAQRVTEGGTLGGSELRALALGLAEALRDIHQAGVVHRDLKPANVLIAEDGPRVIDFGISRAAGNQALTVTGRVIGTPPFMSPEQLHSPRDVQASSDVFSLATLLVYAATGRGPFDSDSPYMTAYQVINEPPVLDGVPEPLRGIAERCLDKDPARRPGLAALIPLFRELPEGVPEGRRGGPVRVHAPTEPDIAGLATEGDSPKRWRRPRLPTRPRPLATALGATLVVAGLGAAAVASFGPVDRGTTPAATRTTAKAAAVPSAWRPWQTVLRKDPLEGTVHSYGNGCLRSGPALYCGGVGFTVARLDAATGEVGWRFTSQVESSAPVTARDGTVVVNDLRGEDQRLTGLEAGSGKRRWSHRISGGSSPVAFGKAVAALDRNGRNLVARNVRSGTELWRSAVPPGEYCELSEVDSVPYARCGGVTGGEQDLLRFDPEDGTSRELGSVPPHTDLVGSDGDALVFLRFPVDANGRPRPYTRLLRMDTGSGAVRGAAMPESPEVTLDDRTRIIDGTLYVVKANGTVAALSTRDGTVKWSLATDMENLSAPVRSEKYGALYFANRYGRLLALRTDGHGELWRSPARESARSDEYRNTDSSQLTLVDDTIVTAAGGLVFSVSPEQPSALPSAVPSASATG